MAALMGVVTALVSGWHLRGTHNEWGAGEMVLGSSPSRSDWFCKLAVFEGGDAAGSSRFRVSRDADTWDEAYPVFSAPAMEVPRSVGMFSVCFRETPLEIAIDDYGHPTWWYVRGTSNGWGAERMEKVNGSSSWCSLQVFDPSQEAPPRFKVAKYSRSWEFSYPDGADVVLPEWGEYRVCFDDVLGEITATQVLETSSPPAPVVTAAPLPPAPVVTTAPLPPAPVVTTTPLPPAVEVTFLCDEGHTHLGQSVYVTGSHPALGSWDPTHAVRLHPSRYPTWEGRVRLPAFTWIEWKCIKRDEFDPSKDLVWQQGRNNGFNTGGTSYTSHARF